MALIKEVTTKEGLTVSYWKIFNIKIDRDKKLATFSLFPWISKATYQSGASPFKLAAVNIRVEDIIYPEGTPYPSILHYTDYFSPEALDGKEIYATIYQYVKRFIPTFENAEDDLA